METKFIFVLLFFMIVVGIPVLSGTISKIHKDKIKLREKELKAMSSEAAEKAAQYAAHTERLEQRVRVLEQIATDKGVETAEQIEALRNLDLGEQEISPIEKEKTPE